MKTRVMKTRVYVTSGIVTSPASIPGRGIGRCTELARNLLGCLHTAGLSDDGEKGGGCGGTQDGETGRLQIATYCSLSGKLQFVYEYIYIYVRRCICIPFVYGINTHISPEYVYVCMCVRYCCSSSLLYARVSVYSPRYEYIYI